MKKTQINLRSHWRGPPKTEACCLWAAPITQRADVLEPEYRASLRGLRKRSNSAMLVVTTQELPFPSCKICQLDNHTPDLILPPTPNVSGRVGTCLQFKGKWASCSCFLSNYCHINSNSSSSSSSCPMVVATTPTFINSASNLDVASSSPPHVSIIYSLNIWGGLCSLLHPPPTALL